MPDIPAITVEQLRDLSQGDNPPYLLDVREKWENDLCQIPGASLIPMAAVPDRLAELPQDRLIVVHCHHGGRSARVVAWLQTQGFDRVANLDGGIQAWSERIDASVKTYG